MTTPPPNATNTTAPIPFTLPVSDTDDPLGVPTQIYHGCDYMIGAEDALEFFYNFLSYQWNVDGQLVGARCYLDDKDRVSVDVSRMVLARDAYAPMLTFLQRRFVTIATMEDNIGYVVGWEIERPTAP